MPIDWQVQTQPGADPSAVLFDALTTASGLVIPDTAKEKPQQGEVLAVGPGRRAAPAAGSISLDGRRNSPGWTAGWMTLPNHLNR